MTPLTGPPVKLRKLALKRLSTPRHDDQFAAEMVDGFLRFERRSGRRSRRRLIERALIGIAQVPSAYYTTYPQRDWPAFENVLLDAIRLFTEALSDDMALAAELVAGFNSAGSWRGYSPPSAPTIIDWLRSVSDKATRARFRQLDQVIPGIADVRDAVLTKIKQLGLSSRRGGGRPRKFDRDALLKWIEQVEIAVRGARDDAVRDARRHNGRDAKARARDTMRQYAELLAEVFLGERVIDDDRGAKLIKFLRHRGMADRVVARHMASWISGLSLRSIQAIDGAANRSSEPPN